MESERTNQTKRDFTRVCVCIYIYIYIYICTYMCYEILNGYTYIRILISRTLINP